MSIILGAGAKGVEQVVEGIRAIGAVAAQVEYERRREDEQKNITVRIDVQLPDAVPVSAMSDSIESVPGVRRVHVRHHS